MHTNMLHLVLGKTRTQGSFHVLFSLWLGQVSRLVFSGKFLATSSLGLLPVSTQFPQLVSFQLFPGLPSIIASLPGLWDWLEGRH